MVVRLANSQSAILRSIGSEGKVHDGAKDGECCVGDLVPDIKVSDELSSYNHVSVL
jgi:hypothetical protein